MIFLESIKITLVSCSSAMAKFHGMLHSVFTYKPDKDNKIKINMVQAKPIFRFSRHNIQWYRNISHSAYTTLDGIGDLLIADISDDPLLGLIEALPGEDGASLLQGHSNVISTRWQGKNVVEEGEIKILRWQDKKPLFQAAYRALEVTASKCKVKGCSWWGSNSRPSDYETDALPTALQKLVFFN